MDVHEDTKIEVACSGDGFARLHLLGHRHGAFSGYIPMDPTAALTRYDVIMDGKQVMNTVGTISNGVGGNQNYIMHAQVSELHRMRRCRAALGAAGLWQASSSDPQRHAPPPSRQEPSSHDELVELMSRWYDSTPTPNLKVLLGLPGFSKFAEEQASAVLAAKAAQKAARASAAAGLEARGRAGSPGKGGAARTY